MCKNKNWIGVIKKLISFALLYMMSAVVMEALVIAVLTLKGYDPLHGEIPSGEMGALLPFYGFTGFIALTLLYVKFIEKKPMSDLLLTLKSRAGYQFVLQFMLGAILVAVTVGGLVVCGAYEFDGLGQISLGSLLLWLLAFVIQSSAEEIMCRGFLLNGLKERIGSKWAIAISGVAFALPHLTSMMEMPALQLLISIVNLLLVSVLFSLVMLKDSSVLSACGLHAGWNFMLGSVLGLSVSGEEMAGGVINFHAESGKMWYTGGNYGIEASVILIPILLLCNLWYYNKIRKREIVDEV